MAEYPYTYVWGNNPVRAKLKGRKCRVLVRGKMNSCLVEFENGKKVTISSRALRRIKEVEKPVLNKETWEGSPSDLVRRYTSQFGLPRGF